jgi:hypothetical protein
MKWQTGTGTYGIYNAGTELSHYSPEHGNKGQILMTAWSEHAETNRVKINARDCFGNAARSRRVD